MLCAQDAVAQWQFCFGMSPGISVIFPPHPVDGLSFGTVTSLTLQTGVNYSFNRKYSAMLLFSYTEYSPTWEAELEESYNYPLSKKLRLKSSAGIAVAFLNNTAAHPPDVVTFLPAYYTSSQDNLFIVMKSGFQWKAPGHEHSVCFGLDYHWGIMRAHQAIIYSTSGSLPSSMITGRGSYLALNLLIFIGKEKYKWKKACIGTKQKNFVM